jgi:hypothetical protein
MSVQDFQIECRSFFKGKADFPSPTHFVGVYAEATLYDAGKAVEVTLSDFDWGGCGNGATVREAYDRANSARHEIAFESGIASTGDND